MARVLKRLLDLSVAAGALVVLAPMLAALWLAVRLRLGRPALFTQLRPGRDGKLFLIYKFRTMTDERGPDGAVLADSARLTPFGRWLRSTSLDELPELVNVVKGDMSLVGPRPLLPQYLELYSPAQRRRHTVRPGITGWCQVRGRNALAWDEKLSLDIWYVDHWSLALDARILAATLRAVVSRQGISADRHATMPLFEGEAHRGAPPQDRSP